MKIWFKRYHQKHSSIVFCFVGFITLIFFVRFLNLSSNEIHQRTNLPDVCDQRIIQKHFMRDRKPEKLLQDEPIRSVFTYQLNNSEFCRSMNVDALIFVISKSMNFESRQAIRRTWGNLQRIKDLEQFSRLRLQLLFLLDIDETRLINVQLEQNLFHDLVQVHLPQHYTLSTYRDMAILHWTEKFCPKTKITVKTDDDVFLNIFLLSNFIKKILLNITDESTNSDCHLSRNNGEIYGIKISQARVVRFSSDPILEGNRYITAYDEYPCKYYPDYMSGFGYLITQQARHALLCLFFRHPKPFFMSDVYVTGILPEYLDIPRRNLDLIISFRSTDDCERFFSENNDANFACASSFHYGTSHLNIFERFNVYWQRIDDQRDLYLNRRFLDLVE